MHTHTHTHIIYFHKRKKNKLLRIPKFFSIAKVIKISVRAVTFQEKDIRRKWIRIYREDIFSSNFIF